MKTYPVVLTIAGSDSSGGAGIQADLKTMSAIGVFGTSAITAITAQNTCEVRDIQGIEPDIVRQQIEAVLDDLPCTTVKLGMLYSRATIETIADCLQRYPLRNIVLDPVMVSTSGCRLIEEEAISAVKTLLLPQATVITPNIPEAEILSGLAIDSEKDMEKAPTDFFKPGCRAVLSERRTFERSRILRHTLYAQFCSCSLHLTPHFYPEYARNRVYLFFCHRLLFGVGTQVDRCRFPRQKISHPSFTDRGRHCNRKRSWFGKPFFRPSCFNPIKPN